MANYCNFEFRVKGNKNAVNALFMSTPSMDYIEINKEIGSGNNYELRFSGNCGWSVNYGLSDKWDGEKIDFSKISEADAAAYASEFSDKSIAVKSAAFGVEVLVHYWSEESGFDQFDHYKNGECIKQRKIAYDYPVYEEYEEDEENDDDTEDFDPTNQVYDVCHIQEENRNEHIEKVRKGDKVTLKCSEFEPGRKGIEVFGQNGLTLGYLLYPADYFMDNIDDYVATVDYVERLSERKQQNKRCRVALLKIRLEMKPDKLTEFNKMMAEKEKAKEEREKEIANKEGVFDWDKTEFIGHEGEYDESVNGEESNNSIMSLLGLAAGIMGGSANTKAEKKPTFEVTQLQFDAYYYIKKANTLVNYDDICKMHPEYSKEAIYAELETLREMGILCGGSIFYGGSLFGIGAPNVILTVKGNKVSEQLKEKAAAAKSACSSDPVYSWTFKEGKRVSGNGWSIAIPDGFVKIESMEDRTFELVPKDNKDMPYLASARVLPGEQQASAVPNDGWFITEAARCGIAEAVGSSMADVAAKMGVAVSEIFSASSGDMCARVLVIDTDDDSYSYQANVDCADISQPLRIQTGNITEKEKNALDKSIKEWLKTIKFDKKNTYIPKMPIIDESDCFQRAAKNDLSKFDKAVEQANCEYWTAVNGRISVIQYQANAGIITLDNLDKILKNAKELMEDAFTVLEYFLPKFDKFIDKAAASKVEKKTMQKIYEKLHEFDETKTLFQIGEEGNARKSEVNEPDTIAKIKNKWKAEEKKLNELSPEEK